MKSIYAAFFLTASAQWPPICPDDLKDGDGPILKKENMGGRVGIERYISEEIFRRVFPTREFDGGCITGKHHLHYTAFIMASRLYPDFAASGDWDVDVRELAAFLATVSQETSGKPVTDVTCGLNSWGGCFASEMGCTPALCKYVSGNCVGLPFDCTPPNNDVAYYGRGPIQLSYNYNYAQFSQDLFGDHTILLNDPDMVMRNQTLLWGSGLWFWMTKQGNKPSCHDVMSDRVEYPGVIGNQGGFGLTTNIINGGVECRPATCKDIDKSISRIAYFQRLTYLFGVPLCSKPNHDLGCGGAYEFPIPDGAKGPRPPCTEDQLTPSECPLSNSQTCYQFDGTALYPALPPPDASCSSKGTTNKGLIPKRRMKKAFCDLPLAKATFDEGYDPHVDIQGDCLEEYEAEILPEGQVPPYIKPDSGEVIPPTPSDKTTTTTKGTGAVTKTGNAHGDGAVSMLALAGSGMVVALTWMLF